MKRLFVFIGIIALFAIANAQDVYVPLKTGYGSYTGTAADTINGTTTADAVFFIELAQRSRYLLSYYVSGDTLNTCSGNVTIQPQGSYDGVTYSNLGSSVTWTTTADYDANTQQNTYTVAVTGTNTNASHTETTAAFNVTQDTTGMQYYFADTIKYPQQTKTVAAQTITAAITNTITLPGTDYRYIKILLTGASGARVELQKVAIKVTPIGLNDY